MSSERTSAVEYEEVRIKELILRIQEWIGYLWSKWPFFLLALIFGGVLGLRYAVNKKPVYTATTTFVVESGDAKGGLGRLAGMAAIAGIDFGSGTSGLFQGDNILELYKSRTMLVEALLQKVHPNSRELLIERYLTYSGLKADWEDRPDLLSLDFLQNPQTLDPQQLRLRDSVLTSIANNIRTGVLNVDKPDKKLSIVQVDVVSPDEVFSKAFNESLVKGVNEFYIQTKTKKTADNILILEKKVDSVRAVMTGAIYSAAKISDATPNLNPTRQMQRIAPTQEAQFSAEANKAMLTQLVQNLELTKMTQLQEQPLIQLVDQPVYPLPVSKFSKIKGIILGAFLMGFMTLMILIGLKLYREIMGDGDFVSKN